MNFILISDAVKLTGLDRQTIRNWIDKGIIPAQKINGTFYVDKDTFEALADKMRDVDGARKRLDELKETCRKEAEMYRTMMDSVRDEHNVIRYLSICVNSGIRTRFFEIVVQMLLSEGILTEKESGILIDLLMGIGYNEVSDKYGCSRERIRQTAEKAIYKSSKYVRGNTDTMIAKNDEIKALKDEIAVLKKMVYREAIRITEDGLSDIEKKLARMDRLELTTLLSKPLDKEPFSVRTQNALVCYTVNGVHKWIKTLGDLCRVSKDDFIQQRNVGKKTVNELTDYLTANGLTWGMDIDRIIGLI